VNDKIKGKLQGVNWVRFAEGRAPVAIISFRVQQNEELTEQLADRLSPSHEGLTGMQLVSHKPQQLLYLLCSGQNDNEARKSDKWQQIRIQFCLGMVG
jgi:hypothetical protein